MDTLAAMDGGLYLSYIGAPVVVLSVLALIGAYLLLRRWRNKGNGGRR